MGCWGGFVSALQDLEPQQLLLFVQSFGIPVSSMSKLLQYLDQAVSHDPQTLEQNIMDKSKGDGNMEVEEEVLKPFPSWVTFIIYQEMCSLGV